MRSAEVAQRPVRMVGQPTRALTYGRRLEPSPRRRLGAYLGMARRALALKDLTPPLRGGYNLLY